MLLLCACYYLCYYTCHYLCYFCVHVATHVATHVTTHVGNEGKYVEKGPLNVNYNSVERWTKTLDPGIAHKKLVMFPINVADCHWILLVVHTHVTRASVTHSIRVYDSYNCRHYSHTEAIKYYYRQEYKNKPTNKRSGLAVQYDITWVNVPPQPNGYDCGVHVCANAFCVAHGLPLTTFTTRNMNYFRQHMANSISRGLLTNMISYPKEPKDAFLA